MDNTFETFGIYDALTPLDGRNRNKVKALSNLFSELSLNRSRILVEIKYFKLLSNLKLIRRLNTREIKILDYLLNFTPKDYQEVRLLERKVNHDVKALEEYLKIRLAKTSLSDISPMIHFGLTSDDTNNIAYAIILKNCLQKVLWPEIEMITKTLKKMAEKWKDYPLLGRTHGQPAVPTTLGKEIYVFFKRLENELENLKSLKIKAKLTGNVGNLNVHYFIAPRINCLKESAKFVKSFGLVPDLATTQIEPYDSYIQIFHSLIRINNLLTGLCLDFWIYISQGYFYQKKISQEVGSTALPHKINPIYFEGAEGGFGIANALLEFYCRKLSSSRLQRDLSDSTVRRSFGIALGYTLLSYQSVCEALLRVEPNLPKLKEELNNHWEILSEAVQNFLRTKGRIDAYDKTKEFFRGREIDQKKYQQFVKTLKLSEPDEKKLISLTPENYTGYAIEIINFKD